MSDTIISVENISKRYHIGRYQQADTLVEHLKNSITYPWRNFKKIANMTNFQDEKSIFWALQDINFEVKQGEVLGIIGHNGAGKSTLLKILSRITEPTTGQIKLRGRLSALLEVGTGFHPELTARDNIYMNGTILGMTKSEIDSKFDEIVEFSGIHTHLDTPVKFYSSGMRVRLAFSVAAHLDPDILVIDEVLAVGDVEFQKKCLGKMQDVAALGRTVLFVSHNLLATQNLCNRLLVLKNGTIQYNGTVNEGIKHYLKNDNENKLAIQENERFKVTNFESYGDSTLSQSIISGQLLSFEISFKRVEEIKAIGVKILFFDTFDSLILNINSNISSKTQLLKNKEGKLVCKIPDFPLVEGQYHLGIEIFNTTNRPFEQLYYSKGEIILNVINGDFYKTGNIPKKENTGIFFCKNLWNEEI